MATDYKFLGVCVQDSSEDGSEDDSDSETPAPEALARYLAIRRYTAIGGASVTTGAVSAGMKTFYGIVDRFSYLHSVKCFYGLHSSTLMPIFVNLFPVLELPMPLVGPGPPI